VAAVMERPKLFMGRKREKGASDRADGAGDAVRAGNNLVADHLAVLVHGDIDEQAVRKGSSTSCCSGGQDDGYSERLMSSAGGGYSAAHHWERRAR